MMDSPGLYISNTDGWVTIYFLLAIRCVNDDLATTMLTSVDWFVVNQMKQSAIEGQSSMLWLPSLAIWLFIMLTADGTPLTTLLTLKFIADDEDCIY